MEVTPFTLSFTFDGKKQLAAGHRLVVQPFKRPMLRVAVGNNPSPEVFIFWEMEDLTVFWHPLPAKKQLKALHIAHALNKHLNPKYRKPRTKKNVKK